MNILQSNPQEHLRSMVGMKGWDFCVYWKLGEDHRCLEWLGCCCCGAEIVESGEHLFGNINNTGSSILNCRDVLFPHPRTKTCDIIDELPSSINLDSGIYAETFLSTKPKWINFSNSTEESNNTRVLIPSMCGEGLVELFVSKHVSEDPQLIQFVSAQCSKGLCSNEQQQQEHALLLVRNHTLHNFQFSQDQQEFLDSPSINEGLERNPSTDFENSIFPQENLSSSTPSMPKNKNFNLFQTWVSESDKLCLDSIHHGFQEIVDSPKELASEMDSMKQEMGRAESNSDCSDQMEEDEDQKVMGKSGKKHQSKNLFAERKRRKKLNERLFALRSLVPKITKMDRASILGDAIEYVKELQKQVKKLQDELEGEKQGSPSVQENGTTHNSSSSNNKNNKNNNNEHEECQDELGLRINDKAQQMEVEVEVNQEGNELNLKIFCEKRAGGFVRLMQAMDFLGLEVIHVNITTFRGLVLNVFKAEMRDDEVIVPEQVRDLLLELTRNPSGWSKAVREGESSSINHHHNN